MKLKGYQERIRAQIQQYKGAATIHASSGIREYWSSKYVRPLICEIFGVPNHIEIYASTFAERIAQSATGARLLSLGCGDCEMEIAIALNLKRQGLTEFVFECVDVSPYVLERGQGAVENCGLGDVFEFHEADLNKIALHHKYDGVMAHHTLHHILELEQLFDAVAASLVDHGVFVSCDMIGRNGHQRWPEALELIEKVWSFLPPEYKKNHVFHRTDETYDNYDCSTSGFEGIRAQDILPNLLRRFHFQKFLAYGNLTDPFINRMYGPNYDVSREFDAGLIDFLEYLNGLLMELGHVKPTKMMAVMGKQPCECKYHRNFTPEFCVRSC